MAPVRELRLVLVTPEKTLLDEPVAALRIPLYDGQMGILPGRAPAISRLGYGELRITGPKGNQQHYFIDGGFMQVQGPVVSILTNRALPVSQLDVNAAREELEAAASRVARTDAEMAKKDREQQRARQMVALATKSR